MLSIEKIFQEVLDGRRSRFPAGTWECSDKAIRCIKYLIERILKWTDDDIKKHLKKSVFGEYKLKGMLTTVYQDSPYAAINHAYPGKFKEWELSTSKNFWTTEKAVEAIRWLVEEKLEGGEPISVKVFAKYGLDGMLQTFFPHNITNALVATYPDAKVRKEVLRNHVIHTKIKSKIQ